MISLKKLFFFVNVALDIQIDLEKKRYPDQELEIMEAAKKALSEIFDSIPSTSALIYKDLESFVQIEKEDLPFIEIEKAILALDAGKARATLQIAINALELELQTVKKLLKENPLLPAGLSNTEIEESAREHARKLIHYGMNLECCSLILSGFLNLSSGI